MCNWRKLKGSCSAGPQLKSFPRKLPADKFSRDPPPKQEQVLVGEGGRQGWGICLTRQIKVFARPFFPFGFL